MFRFSFPVDAIRTFTSTDGVKRYFLQAPIATLPRNLFTEVNARDQNLRTGVARAIRRTLVESPEDFYLLNKGMVITASGLEFDDKSKVVTLDLEDPSIHGVLDGGHTYGVISQFAPEQTEARVMIEVLTGVDDLRADIVGARNTSIQVEEAALVNVRHEFDPILEWLDDRGIKRGWIRVKQFDRDADIPVLDVLAIMHLYDIDEFGNGLAGFDHVPVRAYNQKGLVLKYFKDHTDRYCRKMLPLLPDALWLWDYIVLRGQDQYRQGTNRPFGRLGGVRGNARQPAPGTYMRDLMLTHSLHRGYRLPLMAAMRCLVEEKGGQYAWRDVDLPAVPQEVHEQLGREPTRVERFYEYVAPRLWEELAGEAVQSTPNRIGKSSVLWRNLYFHALKGLSELGVQVT